MRLSYARPAPRRPHGPWMVAVAALVLPAESQTPAGAGCVTPCPPGAFVSVEPTCGPGYVDGINGGCSAAVPAFEELGCGDTVCGTAGNFVTGGSSQRDQDWYRVVVSSVSFLEWRVVAEFNVQVALYARMQSGGTGCPAAQLVVAPSSSVAPPIRPCEEAVVRFWVRPGVYYASVAPRFASQGTPCQARYVATLSCTPALFCPIVCSIGDSPDGEPPCSDGYIDSVNGGCSSSPPTFGTLPLTPAGAAICALTGTFLGGTPLQPRRDEDWFYFTNDVPGRLVRVVGEAPFPFRVALARVLWTPPLLVNCTASLITAPQAWPCQRVDFVAPLNAGPHAVGLLPLAAGGVPCPSLYRLELYDVRPDCPPPCPGGATLEPELPCGPDTVDVTNGGCDAASERFTRIDCFGARYCGTSGVYARGQEGATAPDTDWFEFTLTQPRRVRAELHTLGRLTARLVNLDAGCAGLVLVTPPGIVLLPACAAGVVSACLPPGRYALVIAPDGSDVPCGWPWTLEFTCEDCEQAPCPRGDTSGDGVLNFDDIGCFVAALISVAAWQDCGTLHSAERYLCVNDPSCDGVVDFGDIGPFVACLAAGACPDCP